MKHQLATFSSIFFVLFFALASMDKPSFTGAAITAAPEGDIQVSSLTLDTSIRDFFNVDVIDFPDGACGEVARSLYSDVAFTSMDTSSGFRTEGPDRIATLNFVTDRTARYGTLDMVKGPGMVGDGASDSFISINAETIVRVPKEIRTTYVSLGLYGYTNGGFHIDHGRFSTPSIDCRFISEQGNAICNCEAHPITGIRVAGVTSVRSV